MFAVLLLDGETVGCVLHRGPNKRNLVKSHDLRLKGKLHRLFNSSFGGLTFNYEDGVTCEAEYKPLQPGTEEHFVVVSHAIQERSPYTVELTGAKDARRTD